jgi:hypothetical protein
VSPFLLLEASRLPRRPRRCAGGRR